MTGAERLKAIGGVEQDGKGGGRDEAHEAVEAEAGAGEDEDAYGPRRD